MSSAIGWFPVVAVFADWGGVGAASAALDGGGAELFEGVPRSGAGVPGLLGWPAAVGAGISVPAAAVGADANGLDVVSVDPALARTAGAGTGLG